MGNKKRLAVNTVMLFILTGSNMILSFVTVPYQTRVLGPSTYGILGFAFAAIVYFQLVMDFGFLVSGTAEIVKNKDNPEAISKIFESIFIAKIILFLLCSLTMLILCNTVERFSANSGVFWICLFYSFLNSIIPDFLYRGMEQMTPITIRTVLTKTIFVLGIFLFVKKESDYILVPWLYLAGSFVAVLLAYFDAFRRFHIKLTKISFRDVFERIKSSSPFFVSRIASTVSTATNTLLLGFKYPSGDIVGHYTAAEKIVNVARSGATPISDSLYPYMIANKDFKLVKKVLLVFMPIIVVGSVLLFVFAEPICVFVFGDEYGFASEPLRCLVPVIVFVLPNYLFGFPIMSPLGIEKHANISVVVGAIFQIVFIVLLYVFGAFSVLSLCIVTSLTEFVVFSYRAITVFLHMKKLKRQSAD